MLFGEINMFKISQKLVTGICGEGKYDKIIKEDIRFFSLDIPCAYKKGFHSWRLGYFEWIFGKWFMFIKHILIFF